MFTKAEQLDPNGYMTVAYIAWHKMHIKDTPQPRSTSNGSRCWTTRPPRKTNRRRARRGVRICGNQPRQPDSCRLPAVHQRAVGGCGLTEQAKRLAKRSLECGGKRSSHTAIRLNSFSVLGARFESAVGALPAHSKI